MNKTFLKAASAVCALAFTAGLTACTDGGHEHNFSDEWSKNADNHWHACTAEDCEERSDDAGHEYDGGKITKQPTCTVKGEKTYTCTVCGYTKTEEVAATGHDSAWKHDGATHWQECSHGDSTTKSEPHVWGEGELTHDGYGETCKICGYTRVSVVAGTADSPLTLTAGEHSVYLTVGSLGILAGSYYTFTPEQNGAYEISSQAETAQFSIYADDKLNQRLTGSSDNQTEFPYAEYSFEAGETYYIVVTASETEATVVNFVFKAHTHKYADTLYSEDGYAHWFAGVDGCTDRKDYERHTYGEWEEVTAPQGNKHGLEKQICSGCGHETTRETHSFAAEWTTNELWHWHASLCGHASAEDKLPHTFGEWENDGDRLKRKCSECGYEEFILADQGSLSNPITAVSGANSGTTAEGDYVDELSVHIKHYTFVAEANGTLTFTPDVVDTVICVGTTSFEVNYTYDGDCAYAMYGMEAISIEVNAGQTVYITAGHVDENFTTFIGDYSFILTFTPQA